MPASGVVEGQRETRPAGLAVAGLRRVVLIEGAVRYQFNFRVVFANLDLLLHGAWLTISSRW